MIVWHKRGTGKHASWELATAGVVAARIFAPASRGGPYVGTLSFAAGQHHLVCNIFTTLGETQSALLNELYYIHSLLDGLLFEQTAPVKTISKPPAAVRAPIITDDDF